MQHKLLPLAPGIAYGLPGRFNFRSGRRPESLSRFSDPVFIASLTAEELRQCEASIEGLLEKLLERKLLPARITRHVVSDKVAEKIVAEQTGAGVRVGRGSSHFTVAEASEWIGRSVNRLIKALEPAPGAQRGYMGFRESDLEDIGRHGMVPSLLGNKAQIKRTDSRGRRAQSTFVVDLCDPVTEAQRRSRINRSLRLISPDGIIAGDDFRLGWLLFEAHRFIALDQKPARSSEQVVKALLENKSRPAQALGNLLRSRLEEISNSKVSDEIRWILAVTTKMSSRPLALPDDMLQEIYGLGGIAHGLDSLRWASEQTGLGYQRVQSSLQLLIKRTLGMSIYSPALHWMRDELKVAQFMAASGLQHKLAPRIGKVHVVGACKFINEFLGWRLPGQVIGLIPSVADDPKEPLFFWSKAIPTEAVLDVCRKALDQTIFSGAFSLEAISIPNRLKRTSLTREQCACVIDAWPAARWVGKSEHEWGVIQTRKSGNFRELRRAQEVLEQILHVAWPKALSISSVRSVLQKPLTNGQGKVRQLAPDTVLLQAWGSEEGIKREGISLKLAKAPPNSYWRDRQMERATLKFLRNRGGQATRSDLIKHLRSVGNPQFSLHRDLLARVRNLPYVLEPDKSNFALPSWALATAKEAAQTTA